MVNREIQMTFTRVNPEKAMSFSSVNGGGQEIQFNNFNGDIYIRKGS
jgi:hypothetical protein